MGSRRRLKSANPGARTAALDVLNSTLPARSSLFDFECVSLDLCHLLREAELAKKCVLQENESEKKQWKNRCQRLRQKHAELLATNTELRNQLSVRENKAALLDDNEEIEREALKCVTATQLGTLKYMNQELQTMIEEIRDAVEADEYLYLG